MKKVYLAGKITGDPNYREKFAAAEKDLREQGYVVMNPAILPDGWEWEDYMSIGYEMMRACEIICFLPDWGDSTGTREELNNARRLNRNAAKKGKKPPFEIWFYGYRGAMQKDNITYDSCLDDSVQTDLEGENKEQDNGTLTVYDARKAGQDYCADFQGSDHYKSAGVEPMDLLIASGMALDFSLGNVIKYARRYKNTKNIKDLVKMVDYAHIGLGLEVIAKEEQNESK